MSTSIYDMEKRQIEVVFVREYKGFISAFSKKSKTDYILNVTKIVKDKFNTRFIVPNKVQSFLLNYEVKKLLDKAIKVKNKKYTRIIYLNANLSISTILNSIDFINENIEPEEEWAPDENPEEALMPEDNPGDIYPEGKDETDYPNPVYDDGRPLMSDDIKNIQARLRKYERGGSQDEEFGLNPNDPSNPLGLSKEEMDAFLKDLNA